MGPPMGSRPPHIGPYGLSSFNQFWFRPGLAECAKRLIIKKINGPEMLATAAFERSLRIRRFADLLMEQHYVNVFSKGLSQHYVCLPMAPLANEQRRTYVDFEVSK